MFHNPTFSHLKQSISFASNSKQSPALRLRKGSPTLLSSVHRQIAFPPMILSCINGFFRSAKILNSGRLACPRPSPLTILIVQGILPGSWGPRAIPFTPQSIMNSRQALPSLMGMMACRRPKPTSTIALWVVRMGDVLRVVVYGK